MAMNDSYEEIIGEIKNLINNRAFDAALKILNSELSAPYVPDFYLQEFRALLSQVKQEISLATPPRVLTRAELITMLFDESIDEDAIAGILRNLNLHSIKTEIKTRIETAPPGANYLKGLLIELLIEQRVNIELMLSPMLTINPSLTPSIFLSSWFKELVAMLEAAFAKNPAMTAVAITSLRRYFLSTYTAGKPAKLKEFSHDFVSAVRRMFNEAEVLSPAATKIRQIIAP